jgi:hypothetical protein
MDATMLESDADAPAAPVQAVGPHPAVRQVVDLLQQKDWSRLEGLQWEYVPNTDGQSLDAHAHSPEGARLRLSVEGDKLYVSLDGLRQCSSTSVYNIVHQGAPVGVLQEFQQYQRGW